MKKYLIFWIIAVLKISTITLQAQTIVMFTTPRSMGTLFERSIKASGGIKIIHEPLLQLRFFKSQKETPKIIKDSKNWRDFFLKIKALKGKIFIKDFWNFLIEDTEEKLIFIHRMNFEPSFLIRNPKDTLISHYLKWVEKSNKNLRPKKLLNYDRYVKIYEKACKIWRKKLAIIDANLLINNPRKTLVRYFKTVNLTFSEKALKWEPGYQEEWHKGAKSWQKTVASSSGFLKVEPHSFKEVDSKDQKMLKNLVNKNQKSYEKLYLKAKNYLEN